MSSLCVLAGRPQTSTSNLGKYRLTGRLVLYIVSMKRKHYTSVGLQKVCEIDYKLVAQTNKTKVEGVYEYRNYQKAEWSDD